MPLPVIVTPADVIFDILVAMAVSFSAAFLIGFWKLYKE